MAETLAWPLLYVRITMNETDTATIHAVTIHLDTPNGPVVEYHQTHDEDDVESVLLIMAPEYRADWETTSVRMGHTGRYRAPLVKRERTLCPVCQDGACETKSNLCGR